MAKIKIEHDRENCISCGVCCAMASDFWELSDDGKATLKESKEQDGKFVRELEDKDLAVNKEAAEGCPALVIHLFEESGKKIFPKD